VEAAKLAAASATTASANGGLAATTSAANEADAGENDFAAVEGILAVVGQARSATAAPNYLKLFAHPSTVRNGDGAAPANSTPAGPTVSARYGLVDWRQLSVPALMPIATASGVVQWPSDPHRPPVAHGNAATALPVASPTSGTAAAAAGRVGLLLGAAVSAPGLSFGERHSCGGVVAPLLLSRSVPSAVAAHVASKAAYLSAALRVPRIPFEAFAESGLVRCPSHVYRDGLWLTSPSLARRCLLRFDENDTRIDLFFVAASDAPLATDGPSAFERLCLRCATDAMEDVVAPRARADDVWTSRVLLQWHGGAVCDLRGLAALDALLSLAK
jgi:hypothetical protein